MIPHRWGDAEYCVRRLDSYGTAQPRYEVARFTDDAIPDAIYVVRGNACNCPHAARYGAGAAHKHVRLVSMFRKLGEPVLATFWMEEDKWRVKLWESTLPNP